MIVGLDITKQSSEQWPFEVDFTLGLGTGETISTAVFRAILLSNGADVSADLAQGATSNADGIVSQTIQGRTHGESYMLEFKVTTSAGMVLEAERRLHIRDVPAPTTGEAPLATIYLTATGVHPA